MSDSNRVADADVVVAVLVDVDENFEGLRVWIYTPQYRDIIDGVF